MHNDQQAERLLAFVTGSGKIADVLIRCQVSIKEDSLVIDCGNEVYAAMLWRSRAAIAGQVSAHRLPNTVSIRRTGKPLYAFEASEIIRGRIPQTLLNATAIPLMEVGLISSAMAADRPAAIVSMRTNQVVATNHTFAQNTEVVPLLKWPSHFITQFWEFEGDPLSDPAKGAQGGYDYWERDRESLPGGLRKLYEILEREDSISEYVYKGHRASISEDGQVLPDYEQPAAFCADVYLLKHYYQEPCRLCIQRGSSNISLNEGPPPRHQRH